MILNAFQWFAKADLIYFVVKRILCYIVLGEMATAKRQARKRKFYKYKGFE